MAKIQLIKTEFFPLIVIIFAVTFLILCWLLAQFVSWTGVILLFVAFYWICTSKFITIFAKRNAAVTLLNCALLQRWIQLKFITEKKN